MTSNAKERPISALKPMRKRRIVSLAAPREASTRSNSSKNAIAQPDTLNHRHGHSNVAPRMTGHSLQVRRVARDGMHQFAWSFVSNSWTNNGNRRPSITRSVNRSPVKFATTRFQNDCASAFGPICSICHGPG